MDFIHDVLRKAKEEGKIDPRLLPWEVSSSEVDAAKKDANIEHGSPSKKAKKEEGKIKPRLRPRKVTHSEVDVEKKDANIEHDSPYPLLKIPSEMLDEVKRIVENIRSAAKDKKLQVIGFTSAVPKEGTSTLLSIVSLMIAESQRLNNGAAREKNITKNTIKAQPKKKKEGTLLIDAQLTNPSLHKKFGVSSEVGLIDLLADELDWSSDGKISLNSVVRNISTSNLKLLPVGQKSWKPTSQIDTDVFKSILAKAKRQFELVFLDIPSLLHCAEGITISKLCDGVVLVIQAGQTRWHVLEEAKHLLEEGKVNILGGVLNRRKHHSGEHLSQLVNDRFFF